MNKSPDVDTWLEVYDNPMKPVVSAMRDIILAADDRVSEAVKWQAPTFIYKGNIASFSLRSKSHASLVFHNGADIPGAFDNLTGDGKQARTFKVKSLTDLQDKSGELTAIIKAWCDLKDRG